jgi:uncharacterized protein YdeI (YjbR/CyaY-like superfamily)
MNVNSLNFWISLAGLLCWIWCFWWMYRISADQNRMLKELKDQGQRIERLSKIEHDLIKQVHPQVSEIKEGMEEVIAAVKENTEASNAAVEAAKT